MRYNVSVGEMFAYAYATHRSSAKAADRNHAEAVAERMVEYLLSVEQDSKVMGQVVRDLGGSDVAIDTAGSFQRSRQESHGKGRPDFVLRWGDRTVLLELKVGADLTALQLTDYVADLLIVVCPTYRKAELDAALRTRTAAVKVVAWHQLTKVAAAAAAASHSTELEACWLAVGDYAETVEIPRLPGPAVIDALSAEDAAHQHLGTWTAMNRVSGAICNRVVKLSTDKYWHSPWVGLTLKAEAFALEYAPYEARRLSPIWLWQEDAKTHTQIRHGFGDFEPTIDEVATALRGRNAGKALSKSIAKGLSFDVPLSDNYLDAGRLMWDALQVLIRMRDLGEIGRLASESDDEGIFVTLTEKAEANRTGKSEAKKHLKKVTFALDFAKWAEDWTKGPVYLRDNDDEDEPYEPYELKDIKTAHDWLAGLRVELNKRLGLAP